MQGEKESLDRILNNLLLNAIRYGSDGKYAGLFLREEQEFIYIDIVDKGRGIAKEFEESVFKRLYIMEDSRSGQAQGNGLGLTIAKNLAEQMGGELLLESMIEFPGFYDHMSGRDNLLLHCEYMGYYMPGSVEDTLELMGLSEAAEKPVKSYSLGMRQRLEIARAILCRPELLILDEPTNGLDPAGMKQMRDDFKSLCGEYGITIMLSSHMLSDDG